MFSESMKLGKYSFVAVRLAIAALWLNSDIPRWTALAVGNPQANALVRNLFGPSMVVPLTYFFTILETLGAIAFILGLLTRLTAVWGVVEFAITGSSGVIKDFALLAGSLVLLLNGSPVLSIDGLIAKRKGGR